MASLNEKTPLLQGYNNKQVLTADEPQEYAIIGTDDSKAKATDGKEGNESGRKHNWKIATICILLNELCERMCFFSISSNMVIFCTNVLLYTSVEAVTINLVFMGQ